jgi:hypothetical protein
MELNWPCQTYYFRPRTADPNGEISTGRVLAAISDPT